MKSSSLPLRITLAAAVAVAGGQLAARTATAAPGAPVQVADGASGTTVTGGIVTTDTTWDASGSPYRVTGAVQVAAGATLTVAPGATVIVDATFELEGALTVEGTDQAPVTIQTDVSLFRGIGEYSEPSRAVTITHADITGPGPLTGSDTKYLAFTLVDSTVTDVTSTNYIWYPTDLVMERNVFTRVNTIEIGTQGTAIIRHNRFRDAPARGFDGYNGDAQLVSWAAYGAPMQVTENVFEESVRPRILEVKIDGRMDAPSNYFGATDPIQVKSWVTDKEDDLNRKYVIGIEPLLTQQPVEVPVAAPTTPRGLTAAVASADAVRLEWTAPVSTGGSTLNGYTITATPTPGSGATARTISADPSVATATVKGLSTGTAYTFAVAATNAAGASPTATAIATPRGVPSAPPAPVAGRALAMSGVQLLWQAPANDGGSSILGYVVTATPGGEERRVDADARSLSFRGLEDGVEYTFTVAALNSFGSGVASAPSGGVIYVAPPARVDTPSAVRGDRSATVTWTGLEPTSAPVRGYVVTVLPGGRSIDVSAEARSVVVPGLTNGRAYSFTVKAANEVGYGPESAASNMVTPAGRPGTALRVRAAVAGKKATVTWRPAPANGAPVQRYQVLVDGKTQATAPGRATKVVLRGLKKGKHVLRVRAANAVGPGPLSAPIRIVVRTR